MTGNRSQRRVTVTHPSAQTLGRVGPALPDPVSTAGRAKPVTYAPANRPRIPLTSTGTKSTWPHVTRMCQDWISEQRTVGPEEVLNRQDFATFAQC